MIKSLMILTLGLSLTTSLFARDAVIDSYTISSTKSETAEGTISVHIQAEAVALEAGCEATRARATLELSDREDGKTAIVAVIRRMFIARRLPCAVVENPTKMKVEATFEFTQDQLKDVTLLNVNEFGNDLALSDLIVDEVVVTPVPAVELVDCAKVLSAQPVICTMEFNPSTCTYGDVSAKGSNGCAARANIQRSICQDQSSFNPKEIRCTSGQAI